MHRLALFAVVVSGAAILAVVWTIPVLGSTGRAMETFNRNFLGDPEEALPLPPFPERSTIYASDGSILATLFLDENRKTVSLDQVNEVTRQAVLAIEDHEFYEHGAVNLSSIVRAMLSNLRAGEVVQGGSTISQQLIKNVVTGSDETLARKIKEVQGAIRLERQFTKDQILELYLNEVYFGHGVYGIAAASEYYFAKKPEWLTLPEAATLAGMIAAPERFDPIDFPPQALGRRNEVLDRMLSLGWIEERQHAEARAAPLKLSKERRVVNEQSPDPYFVQYVKSFVLSNPRFGKTFEDRKHALYQGGLRIHTTLLPAWQQDAKAAVEANLPNPGPEPPADPQTAVVSVESRTGAIRVMVGGANFSKFKYNLATGKHRGAGSAMKAFTLAAAIENGVPPGKVYDSEDPIFIPECDDWNVDNAEPSEGGYVNLWDATQHSINVVFAQLIRDIGAEKVAEIAMRMGITSEVPPFCSVTLGTVGVSPLDMASAYSTLANEGVHCSPFAVSKIVSRRGKVLYRAEPRCERAISEQVAAQVTAMLEPVVDGGTGSAADIGRPVAGKTGTGQEFRDAWFVGYIPQVSTSVWVGYSKGLIDMVDVHGIEVFGGTYPAEIWGDFMAAAVEDLPVEDFPPPPPEERGVIPDVVGQMQEDAEEILADADFTAVPEEVFDSAPAGTVLWQDPEAGLMTTLGSPITIGVSNGLGPPLVEVLDLLGLPAEEARAALEEVGLRASFEEVAVEEEDRDGLVVEQAPGPGEEVEEGSTVTLVVGRFEEPEPTQPSPTTSASPSPSASPSESPPEEEEDEEEEEEEEEEEDGG